MRVREASQLNEDLQRLKEKNEPLSICIGECQLADVDIFKKQSTAKLKEIDTNFNQKMQIILEDYKMPKEMKKKLKADLATETKQEFNKTIDDAHMHLEEQDKATRALLASNNVRLSSLDENLLANPELTKAMIADPVSFLDVKFGEANAQLILTLKGRGFIKSQIGQGDTLINAIDRRFSKDAFDKLSEIENNHQRLKDIATSNTIKMSRFAGYSRG